MFSYLTNKYLMYCDCCQPNAEVLTAVVLDRLRILCEFRKIRLDSPDYLGLEFKESYMKNTIVFVNNLPSKDEYLRYWNSDSDKQKITVLHVVNLIKFLQEKYLGNQEILDSLEYILNHCNQIPENEYFLDLTALFAKK